MANDLIRPGLAMALLCGGIFLTNWTREASAQAIGVASPWQETQMSQVRLVAGRQGPDGGEIVAGIEIAMQDGWKTYWRSPGDAGGVPPELDWSQSQNVAETRLVYPAPMRFRDKSGETIGYKGNVVLPVLVQPADKDRPVELRAQFHFGICRDICIPVSADLSLTVPKAVEPGLPPELVRAMSHAPRSGETLRPGDPRLVAHEVILEGAKPRIVLDINLGPKAEAGDVFVEASNGVYLPMPQRVKDANGTSKSRFEIDLLQANDPAELKGKTVRVTMVGSEGQSEASFVIE